MPVRVPTETSGTSGGDGATPPVVGNALTVIRGGGSE